MAIRVGNATCGIVSVSGVLLSTFENEQDMRDYIVAHNLIDTGEQTTRDYLFVGGDGCGFVHLPCFIVREQNEEGQQTTGSIGGTTIYSSTNPWESITFTFDTTTNIPNINPDAISKKAIQKSRELLLNSLTKDERLEMESFETVTIITPTGIFRVDCEDYREDFYGETTPSYNVKYKRKEYCLVIDETEHKFPYADHLLNQILLIKTNPKKFLKIANHRNY